MSLLCPLLPARVRFVGFAALVLLTLPVALRAAAMPVESAPTAVTVYPDRAVVTRTARLDLAAGAHELVFGPLPAGIDADSLQVAARGPARATILDVAARTTFVAAPPDPRLRELEDALRDLAREGRRLDDRAAVLARQMAYLAQIETASTTIPAESTGPRPGIDEWIKLLAFAGESRSQITTEVQSIDVAREELATRRAPLAEQLQRLRGATNGRQLHTIVVRLAAAVAGELTLDVSYAIGGASWQPSYDARLARPTRQVTLDYFGTVRQTTGEDWREVRLTLSTARPALGGGAPELRPWIVDVFTPPPPASLFASADESLRGLKTREARPQTFGNALALAAAPEAPGQEGETDATATFALAELAGAASSASFRIAATATITSDGTPQRVGITQVVLPAQLQFQSSPRQLEAAFLGAYLTNRTDFPLLAGPLSAFVDDTFITRSQLRTVMAGEKFDLALGVDEGIAVKRRVVNRFTETIGLTSSTTRVTYELLITLTNHKSTPERVVFKEPLPVSRHEAIIVRLAAPAERDVGTPAAPREVTREEDGKLVWRVDLQPGEKREFPLRFSVEHPRTTSVNGLE